MTSKVLGVAKFPRSAVVPLHQSRERHLSSRQSFLRRPCSREALLAKDLAPKTINRRIASLSSFYKYLSGAAAELRLPITVPNPAHAQSIARESSDARDETKAVSATRARQLMGLPAGDSLVEYRDRAILKLYLYSGIRLGTGCRLKVSDFHVEGDEATIRLHEKGDKRRTIGLHYNAAQAIKENIDKAEITSGPLFRPRVNPRSRKLSTKTMDDVTMWTARIRGISSNSLEWSGNCG